MGWNAGRTTMARMPQLPVLYSFRRCPYAMRARLALAVSGSCVELREVVLRRKPAAFLAASPKATVPVLVMPDGAVIDESLRIMQWALAQNDPHGWLSVGTPPGDTLALIDACDNRFKQALDRCKYPERFAMHEVRQSWLDAEAWLQTLSLRLTLHAALCGEETSLADAAIFPFVRQFAAIDPVRWRAMPIPQVHTWLDGWLSSDLFASIMHKYPPWEDGAAPLRVFG